MLPFSIISQYGNDISLDDQYIGYYDSSSLSYSTVLGYLSPTGAAIAEQSIFRCFRFIYNEKNVIVPSQPMAYASYQEVYEKGMVYGTTGTGPDIFDSASGVTLTNQDSTVNILGRNYYITLMSGIDTDTLSSTVIDSPAYSSTIGYDRYIYSILSGLNTANFPSYFDVPSTDRVSKFSLAGSTRRWVLCRGSDGSRTSPRSVGRGRYETGQSTTVGYGVSQLCTSSISPLWTVQQNIWWPVFVEV